jgi:hypothetical protein
MWRCGRCNVSDFSYLYDSTDSLAPNRGKQEKRTVLGFYWIDDEWRCPRITRKYADKIAHGWLHYGIVIAFCLWFKKPIWQGMVVSEAFGWTHEWITDCVILNKGASKYDLIANNVGMVAGGVTLRIGGW